MPIHKRAVWPIGPRRLKSLEQLLWQKRLLMDVEVPVTREVSSQAPIRASAALLLDLKSITLPPAPATIEFHHGVALARKQDRCTRGQVADV